jgi:prevent-host-death family protein
MLKLPRVLGVSEARQELSSVLDQVERGETFVIKGAGRGGAFLISAELFRRLQESYLELVGELETERILRDEKAIGVLRAVSPEISDRRYTLAEIEDMVAEDDDR